MLHDEIRGLLPKMPSGKEPFHLTSHRNNQFISCQWKALENCSVPFGGKLSPFLPYKWKVLLDLKKSDLSCLVNPISDPKSLGESYYQGNHSNRVIPPPFKHVLKDKSCMLGF